MFDFYLFMINVLFLLALKLGGATDLKMGFEKKKKTVKKRRRGREV